MNKITAEPIDCDFVGRPYISSWLPGETLFSMASRHHILAGNPTPAATCRQLFGHLRIGSAHDFPARVGYLAAQTQGQLGSPRNIILDHTITRFFFPFHSPKKCANWMTQMTLGTASQLKSQLGLLSARFGAAHPLKACAQCMIEDVRLLTVAYWHVEHQIPGVWVCPHHHALLLTSRKKWSGENRFGWCLPFEVELVPPAGQFGTSAFDALNRIAGSAIALWKLAPDVHFSAPSLAATYAAAMAHSGFLLSCGRIEHKTFGNALHSFFERVSCMEEFSGLVAAPGHLSATFARMTNTDGAYPRGHPLKHLILIDTLFGRWANFWTAYQNTTIAEPGREEIPVMAPTTNTDRQTSQLNDERKSRFRTLLATPGISLRSAAVSSGVAVGTAMTWAADSGVSVRRRAKILKPALREALISQLQLGAEKVVAAKLAKVSVETVTRLLLTEPGLHSCWKEARAVRAQAHARSTWTTTIQTLPYLSSVEWRKLEPATYAWLYRNDRAWLQQSIQERPHPPTQPELRIRWGQRDIALARSIRAAASTWCQSHPGKRLTIAIVCGLVPTLKARLSKLNLLPLTRKALTEISGRKLRTGETQALWSDALD